MKKIYLFCSAGMSTSMLAGNMQEVADEQNLSSFFEWLGSTANNYQKISLLMKSDSYEAFIEKIIN